MHTFRDRIHAGKELAKLLHEYADAADTLVLGLPRGGVPVAHEVARTLHLPLDVLIVRKIGAPTQPELAVGAIASGGSIVWNDELVSFFPAAELEEVVNRQRQELTRRELLYRGRRAPLDVKNRTIILVDDGAATGASMRVTIRALRAAGARQIVAALPVASDSALGLLESEADEVHCVLKPEFFEAVGQWYRDFSETTDEDVTALLSPTSTTQ